MDNRGGATEDARMSMGTSNRRLGYTDATMSGTRARGLVFYEKSGEKKGRWWTCVLRAVRAFVRPSTCTSANGPKPSDERPARI